MSDKVNVQHPEFRWHEWLNREAQAVTAFRLARWRATIPEVAGWIAAYRGTRDRVPHALEYAEDRVPYTLEYAERILYAGLTRGDLSIAELCAALKIGESAFYGALSHIGVQWRVSSPQAAKARAEIEILTALEGLVESLRKQVLTLREDVVSLSARLRKFEDTATPSPTQPNGLSRIRRCVELGEPANPDHR